jgi:hypothetical protein
LLKKLTSNDRSDLGHACDQLDESGPLVAGRLQARNEHALIGQKRARLGNHFALVSSIRSLFAK